MVNIIKKVMEDPTLKVTILNTYKDENKVFYGVFDGEEYYTMYSIGDELYNEFGSLIYAG